MRNDAAQQGQPDSGPTFHDEFVFDTIDDYLAQHVDDESARRPIRKVLLATNGIAAVKCMHSVRQFLVNTFRDERVVKFVCMATTDEIAASSEYLKLADCIVFSPPGSNRNNYANVDEIVCHALEQRVDAVWAGWGHASENPDLPRRLAAKNVIFIGPPSGPMAALGDKIASTIIAQTLGIPTIEWSGSGVVMADAETAGGRNIEVPQELFDRATVNDFEDGLRVIQQHGIGFPLMIKASEGGGGKGIRKCAKLEEFREMFEEVEHEVPQSPIFLMKCVQNARHVEVQILADRSGNVIPAQTRDCTIQRRCQKVIEEAPASVVPPQIARSMQEDAVKIAKLVGYESAGTVEYLYLPEEGRYCFLELNPRLQVEHPCTEMLLELNIPAIQFAIAMGVPLHRIREIRKMYGMNPEEKTPLPADVVVSDTKRFVVAARITSEDPDDYFRPSTGDVQSLIFRASRDVWAYFSVSGGCRVHEFADSQFGHVFARGNTRHQAVSELIAALNDMELNTTFVTQKNYLIALLNDATFTSNQLHTQWLDNRIVNKVKSKEELPLSRIIAISGALVGYERVTKMFADFKRAISNGQILPPTGLSKTLTLDLVKDLVVYKVAVTKNSKTSFIVTLNGTKTSVEVVVLGNDKLLVTHNGHSFQCAVSETVDSFKVVIGRSLIVFEKDNDPTVLKSPYTGKLLAYKKENMQHVSVGETFATIESMKLVFNVEVKKAPGRLIRVANEGDVLYPGSVIALLCEQPDAHLYRPRNFEQTFDDWSIDANANAGFHGKPETFFDVSSKCKRILRGMIPFGDGNEIEQCFDEFDTFLNNKHLVNLILKPLIADVAKMAREPTRSQIRGLAKAASDGLDIDVAFLKDVVKPERAMSSAAADLFEYCELMMNGQATFVSHLLLDMLLQYIRCEKFYDGKSYDVAVAEIKDEVKDVDEVVALIYSHTQLEGKNRMMEKILEKIRSCREELDLETLEPALRTIGNLTHVRRIAAMAHEILYVNAGGGALPGASPAKIERRRRSIFLKADSVKVWLLEVWRLPKPWVLVSDESSILPTWRIDDADKKFSRLFVRQILSLQASEMDLNREASKKFCDAIDNAFSAICVFSESKLAYVGNHVFIFVQTPFNDIPNLYEQIIRGAVDVEVRRRRELCRNYGVTEIEVVFARKTIGVDKSVNARMKYVFGPGGTLEFETCDVRVHRHHHGHEVTFQSFPKPHAKIAKIDKKRYAAGLVGTTYVYDYPTLFGHACLDAWRNYKVDCSLAFNDEQYANRVDQLPETRLEALISEKAAHMVAAEEFVLKHLELITDGVVLHERASMGKNECAVVAWRIVLFTPERPKGHAIVVIANDITFQSGSFAVDEDRLFAAASAFARANKLPRVNVSCNSGARIGLAEKVAAVFRAKFKPATNPGGASGHQEAEELDYLCVDAGVRHSHTLGDQVVGEDTGDGLVRLRAVIGGTTENIGVENLQGSGLIAGETSCAYDEIPTYCLVTGRSVGIGAYTARLAHRIVQSRAAHIILTGAPALNTLLGQEVYTSNNQLGGVDVMHRNGVAHAVVDTDFEGVFQVVKWLSYLPVKLPTFPYVESFGADALRRPVVLPEDDGSSLSGCSRRAYDMRQLIDSGSNGPDGGICDSNSFDEIMSEWAKSIIAGRARIGGFPVGVLASELESTESVVPADPAVPGSQAQTVRRAGQVWYPDSALKTAEVIKDFNNERLPLLFIASLRGFSGGQRDMYEMVLKFGAEIVRALRHYRMPVIVYIPHGGELRGGAWAVLDTMINPGFIHMVADETSRGGILEPNAIVGIKFRDDKIFELQKRSDATLKGLCQKLDRLQEEKQEDSALEREHLESAIRSRAQELKKAYRLAAVEFADLHDRSERMLAKKAIEHVTSLRNSRNLFISILRIEISKVSMAEIYASWATNKSLHDALNWVTARLSGAKNASKNSEEFYQSIRAYVQKQFLDDLRGVAREEVQRISKRYERLTTSSSPGDVN